MRTILATNNSEIFYETKGTAYLGVVENGKIILGDAGFEFEYKNPRRGQNIFFTWSSIKSAEVDVSISGKLGQQFSLILDTQAKVRFSSKDSGSILKKLLNMWVKKILSEHLVCLTLSVALSKSND